MKRRLFALVICLFSACGLAAQPTVLDEQEYWRRLEQTVNASPARITDLWQDIDSVRLEDGTIIPIDTGWLRSGSADTRQARVESILKYRSSGETGAADDEEALAVLARILQEEPAPTGEIYDTPHIPIFSFGDAGQIILFVLAVIAAVFVVVRVVRTLSVQGAELLPNQADEDPTTSEAAQKMAEQSHLSEDYRSAVRYLYLALLLRLDERQLIRYNPTMTNREHLEQVREHPRLFQQLRTIVQKFDDVWYGYAPVDAGFYRGFRQQIDQIYETQ